MRVAIVGSRHYPGLERVVDYVRGLPDGTEVVSGGAVGVDRAAACAANDRCIEDESVPRPKVFLPAFERDGVKYDPKRHKQHYAIRNQQIVDYADVVVAFWDGKSAGTRMTLDMARKAGKPVTVYGPDGKEMAI